MTLPPNIYAMCNTCLGLNGRHQEGCPMVAEEAPMNEVCGLCGCDLEDDETQICADCSMEHPGD